MKILLPTDIQTTVEKRGNFNQFCQAHHVVGTAQCIPQDEQEKHQYYQLK